MASAAPPTAPTAPTVPTAPAAAPPAVAAAPAVKGVAAPCTLSAFFGPLLNNFVEIGKKIVDPAVLLIAPEIGHLAPIIVTFGAAFFALISFNYPLAVFAASGAEAAIIYSFFSAVGDALSFPTKQEEANKPCKSSFETMTPARFAVSLRGQAYPNSPLYFLSFTAAYLIQSMASYSEERTALGPQYSSRPYIALIGAFMLITLYAAYLLAFKCDSLLTISTSILIGGFIGYLLSSQNYFLLGKQSISVLFVPPLVNTSPNYLCVQA